MAKFCPECGYPISDTNAQFCPKCGATLPAISANRSNSVVQPVPPSVQTPMPLGTTPEKAIKKRSTLEWIAIICGGAILLVIVSAFIVGMITGVSSSSSSSSQFSSLSVDQIKAQSQNIPYTNLMHSPDSYKNTIVYYRGQILQVQQEYGNTYEVRIATNEDAYEDVIYVDYTGNRPVEGDIVDEYGNFVGLKTYTAVPR